MPMIKETSMPLERAVLAGAETPYKEDYSYSMEELRNLATACQLEVVGEISQKINRVHPAHYIGSGKLDELGQMIQAMEAETVIFNDELSPAQIRNLENRLDVRVIDRTLLILDIFQQRAKTKEAQMQVESARLKYMLPRLIGLRESLGRQGGGAGLNNRGSGETKLELDRRKIEERISSLQSALDKIVAQRETSRQQRRKNNQPLVCLVGYTNAGKSSLMNAMLETFQPEKGKQVQAKDMLFATLETSVRSIQLPDNKKFLLTDTVGFVSQLPHHLVKAFRSTLEEVTDADLLIHVVDCSNPNYKQQLKVTEDTLHDLGAENLPQIYAFNKADASDWPYPFVDEKKDVIYLSAKQRSGLKELSGMIRRRVFQHYIQGEILIPFDQGHLVSYFNEHAHVKRTTYDEQGTKLVLECKAADYEKHRQYFL